MSPRGVLSRNVVRNCVRGALATRHAVRTREGVTFLRFAQKPSIMRGVVVAVVVLVIVLVVVRVVIHVK